MVRVEHKQKAKEADLAGLTIAEARRQFEGELGFNRKSVAMLNGVRISGHREGSTILHDDDTLMFRVANHRVAYLMGALLMVFAITGGTFAFGFINSTTTLSATTVDYNFAEVSANTTISPSWQVLGGVKGATGNATLFDIDTASSGYTGDLLLTVSLANMDELTPIYRSMALSIELRDGSGDLVDINEDGNANAGDFVVLTLDNGTVTLPFEQTAAQVYTVWIKSGSYIAQIHSANWANGSAAPQFFCEIAQR